MCAYPADDLVVDRAGDAGVLLDEKAVPDDRHGRAEGQLTVELDGERVHGDGADGPPALAVDEHGRSGQVAAEAVRVAEGDEPDPGRLPRDEHPAVARRLAGLEPLDVRQLAPPREHRLEAVLRGVGSERRKAVEGDPAAGGVEARIG